MPSTLDKNGCRSQICKVVLKVTGQEYFGREGQLNSPGIENEMELCPRDVTDKISYQGFNRSFAGTMVVFTKLCSLTLYYMFLIFIQAQSMEEEFTLLGMLVIQHMMFSVPKM